MIAWNTGLILKLTLNKYDGKHVDCINLRYNQ